MKNFYCENCKTSTLHKRESTSHVWHFIITLLFAPWFFVWVWRYASKSYVCQCCGTCKR